MQDYEKPATHRERPMVRRSSAVIAVVCVALAVAMLTAGVTMYLTGRMMISQQVVVAGGDYQLLDRIKGMFASYGLEGIPVDDQTLLEGAADGLVAATGDRYAQYFNAEEYDQLLQEDAGEYVGIGVTVQQDTETGAIMVMHVIDGSPAMEAGVGLGDAILAVDGEEVTPDMDVTQLANRVRGEEHTEVELTLRRPDGSQDTLSVTRRKVTEERVLSRMLNEKMGYLQITQFAGKADQEFMEHVAALMQQGARGLVLDLRNNPGGDKQIVCAIADALFPKGPIITMVDKNGNKSSEYSDTSCLNIPLVVLVNEYSASASELLTGGIQDYGVGTVVGVTTYGKGVVQSFIPMSGGESVMKLTTHDYLTPLGRSIQDVGCVPDVICEASEEMEKNPALMGTDQDNQLARAVEVLSGKISAR